jgi:hypothetical protein
MRWKRIEEPSLDQKALDIILPAAVSTQQQRVSKSGRILGWFAAITVTLFFLTERTCALFPESSFKLARESRLPRWFAIPPGLTRSQLVVKLDYYVLPWGSRARFRILGPDGGVLDKATGVIEGEPRTLKVPSPGFPGGYPSYEIVSIGGLTEIIEHRKMEPIFYVSDDPAVRTELMAR